MEDKIPVFGKMKSCGKVAWNVTVLWRIIVTIEFGTATTKTDDSILDWTLRKRECNIAVLWKNTVRAFECCQISLQKISIFEECYEYFSLQFSGTLWETENKILWKIGERIFISSLGNPFYIVRNLATPEGCVAFFRSEAVKRWDSRPYLPINRRFPLKIPILS